VPELNSAYHRGYWDADAFLKIGLSHPTIDVLLETIADGLTEAEAFLAGAREWMEEEAADSGVA
jgi:hypothetical protein